MYLFHILLPLNDNDGKPLDMGLYRRVATELTKRFGGLTAHTRAPAEGRWNDGRGMSKDEIVIYEVMTEILDESWWREYRHGLEQRFRQEKVIVRAQEVWLL